MKLSSLIFILTLLTGHFAFAAKEVIGIEVILAGASDRSVNTRFGHAFLRLVDNDKRWTNDTVYSFGFELDPSKPLSKFQEIQKTLTGEFPLVMNKTSLGNLWSRYELHEVRNLSRHIIPTTKESRELLLNSLADMHANMDSLGQYSLLTNNCLTVVIDLLKSAGIPFKVWGSIVPSSINSLLFESGVSWLAPIKFKSKNEVAMELGLDNVFTYFTDKEFLEIINNWSDEKIKLLLAYQLKLNSKMLRQISSKREIYNTRSEHAQLVGHKSIDPLLYQVCKKEICVENKLNLVKRKFGSEYIKKISKFLHRNPNFYDPDGDDHYEYNMKHNKHPRIRTANNQFYDLEFEYIQEVLY